MTRHRTAWNLDEARAALGAVRSYLHPRRRVERTTPLEPKFHVVIVPPATPEEAEAALRNLHEALDWLASLGASDEDPA